MDSLTIKPTLVSSFSFNLLKLKPQTYSTTLSFTHFRRFTTSSNTHCYTNTTPSNPKNQNSKFSNQSFPPNPFWVILQSIKVLATSQTQKWASSVQAYSDTVSDKTGGVYLQSGGLGVALLSVTSNAKVRISPFVATLAANPTFVSGLLAWFMAQSIKVILNFFVERKWDLRILFASGGMPSSHSALCTALTTSVALCHGVADSLFPVLNMIVEDLFQGHPISQRKLKELLGHTPSQVLAGALLGIVVAYFGSQAPLVPT
ncbi:putative membrane protein yuid [Quercus suber]|uniref:Membrane protein yuid n=1 Tax=Quercus suber TaxID=58331 RepID=A0AAW0J2Y6_QUESU